MGRRRGEAGGVEREEEREERSGEAREEAVEGEDDGVVGGVGMESLGLGRSEDGVVVVADELVEERPVLRDERLSFGVDEVLVGGGSMAESKKH